MAIVILEGLDRTGKSSVAEYFKTQGYEVIHQSAPKKGLTEDLYVEEQVQILTAAAQKDIVLDRSYYGELVWPIVYNRQSLLSAESLEILRELEESAGVTRILMHDPNIEAHWQRCVDNNEPLTKPQFIQARRLFNEVADRYNFTKTTLQSFGLLPEDSKTIQVEERAVPTVAQPTSTDKVITLTKEQMKLERANAINAILSKRILKQKGGIYDELENGIRSYLNAELGKIFGEKVETSAFTPEEVELLKFFCNKLKEGQR